MVEGDFAINVAAEMRDGEVSNVGGINALRKQGKGVKEIEVLSVVIEAERSFNFAAANAQPGLEAVVGDRPVQRRMVLAQLTEIAVVNLGPDQELVRDVRGHINAELGEAGAALAGVHGQPIVVAGINESLRDEAVDLDRAVKEFEFLCLQPDLEYAEKGTGESPSDNSSMHAPSLNRWTGIRSVNLTENLKAGCRDPCDAREEQVK